MVFSHIDIFFRDFRLGYGYLKGTASMNGGGIDIWRGCDPKGQIDAIVCTVDLNKRDSEIKVLIGCTEEEMARVYQVHNETDLQIGIQIRKDTRELLS